MHSRKVKFCQKQKAQKMTSKICSNYEYIKSYMWTAEWRIIWRKIIAVIYALFTVTKRKPGKKKKRKKIAQFEKFGILLCINLTSRKRITRTWLHTILLRIRFFPCTETRRRPRVTKCNEIFMICSSFIPSRDTSRRLAYELACYKM